MRGLEGREDGARPGHLCRESYDLRRELVAQPDEGLAKGREKTEDEGGE